MGFALAVALVGQGPADTLIVANKYEGTVSFIDWESGQEVARPETGPSPHEVALSPDGTRVVVVSYLEGGNIGRGVENCAQITRYRQRFYTISTRWDAVRSVGGCFP